jgi:hypothetical protein
LTRLIIEHSLKLFRPPSKEKRISVFPAENRTKMKTLSHKSCWCAVGEALSINFSFACLASLLLCCALSLAVSVSKASESADAAPRTFQRSSSASVKTDGDLKKRQIEFLNRLRKADPKHQTIERAVFNEQNELGVVLNRGVELDKISALMRSILVQMARAFPGQDLTVLAYAPSNPPRKIGTARLNARTRDMTYTPER